MACALPVWLALMGSGAVASAMVDTPPVGASLAELENWALTAAPTVLLAQAEQDVAAHRNGTAQASQGARLFGGTGISTAGVARSTFDIAVSADGQWVYHIGSGGLTAIDARMSVTA